MYSLSMIAIAVIKTTIRDKVLPYTIIAIGISGLLSRFIGQLGMVEKSFFIATYVSSTIRVISILCITLITSMQIQKMYDSREMDRIIAQPIPRYVVTLGCFIGFVVVSCAICAAAGATLFAMSSGGIVIKLIWCLSLETECIMMITLSMALSTVWGKASISTLYSLGIYFAGRIIAFILLNRPDHAMDGDYVFVPKLVLKLLCFAIPRLDMTAQSSWLIYGIDNPIATIIVHFQLLFYCAMLIFITMHDIENKQF